MATPVWTTTAGKLASIDEQVAYSLQLEANTSDSTAITYSVIAGSLPSGLELTSTGLLTGIPAEIEKRTRYTFVVRATAGSQITDRTFYLDVEGQDAPTFTTASGQLQLDDSSREGLYWVLDGSKINFQVQATDIDTRQGHSLVYEIISGKMPNGVTLSSTGLVSGTVDLLQEDFEDSTATTGYSKILAKSFEFTIRVTDGTSVSNQTNSIFVYSADYWRVSNTNIRADMNTIGGSALTVDFSSTRRPIFTTGSDLGTFRHDNQVAIVIDVEDKDPLLNDINYSLQSGSLPTGLSLNTNNGEITGQLPRQAAVEETFTFTIRANRVVSGGNVFTDQTFTMKVIGELDIGIAFTTPAVIGTLVADQPSLLSIEAVADNTDRTLIYSVSSGTLPTGITLSTQGNLIGTIDASDFDDSTTSFTFTVTVSDQYQETATTKEFTLNVEIPFTTIEYGSMTGHATSYIDQNIFYNIAQDPNINSTDYIYRGEDPEFGMRSKPEMLLVAGLEAQTLTTLQRQMEQNHSPKTVYFGDLKTAVAKENGVIKYEVVYIEMKDKLVNNLGESISSSVTVRTDIAQPMLGPRAGSTNVTIDAEEYNVTTAQGVGTSGSKQRVFNPLTTDLDFLSTLYPNSLANMRSRIKILGHKEWTHLPLWMRTTQTGALAPMGWTPAVVLCYCKPGTSALLKKRIEDKNLNFKNIDFIIDRYVVGKSKITPAKFTGDGSTTSFVLDEIVHEQDILVKEGTERVYVGLNDATSDNYLKPDFLTADTILLSADDEFGITLSHDNENQKTTITFRKSIPSNGTIIKVDRLDDKYLKFKGKGIF